MSNKIPQRFARASAMLLALLLVAAPLPAQKRRRTTPAHSRRAATATRPQTTTRNSSRPITPSTAGATRSAPSTTQGATTQGTTTPGASTHGATPTTNPASAASSATVQNPSAEGELSFDTLLPADSYALYIEVRGVGQQMRTGGIVEMLSPIYRLGDAPAELKRLVSFLETHAEMLNNSRLLLATWPVDPMLPQGIAALELPSEEVARKLTPELQTLLAAIMPPKPSKEAAEDGTPARRGATLEARTSQQRVRLGTEARPSPSKPFQLNRVGNLIIISDTPLKLKSLRTDDTSKRLSNNPHFRTARNRFANEPVFTYYDLGAMQRTMRQTRERLELEQAAIKQDAGAPVETDVAVMAETNVPPPDTAQMTADDEDVSDEKADETTEQQPGTQPDAPATPAPGTPEAGLSADSPELEAAGAGVMMMLPSLFGGSLFGEKWPEALGLAASLEDDSIAVRALLFNPPDTARSPIPFFPMLISGAPVAPDAPTVLPAETEIYVSTSVDLPQIYEHVTKAVGRYSRADEQGLAVDEAGSNPSKANSGVAGAQGETDEAATGAARIAALEKMLGFKIKEDLIDSLGNEIAVSLPPNWFNGKRSATIDTPNTTTETTTATTTATDSEQDSTRRRHIEELPLAPEDVVVLISVKDRDKLQRIMPRVRLLLGFAGGGTAQATKYKDVELTTFGRGAMAFVGNYFVFSPSLRSMHRVIDAQASGQTLASIEDFRRSMQWQPRQSLGQVYVSHMLLNSLFADARSAAENSNDPEMQTLRTPLSLDLGSITHLLTDEGDGMLHELRVPRNLVAMFAAMDRVETKQAPVRSSEYSAIYSLRTIHSAQTTYQSRKGNGAYATLQQLQAEKMLPESVLDNAGYRIEVTASGDKFEATATPIAYPDKGRRSFFIDESGVLRGSDKGGQRASATDEPVR